MRRKLTFRQLLLSVLALWNDLSQKEIGSLTGIDPKEVSQYLRRKRRGEIKDDLFERLLAGINCSRAAVWIVTACLEALEALEREGDLTPEERAVIEEEILASARLHREALTEAVRLSRGVPAEGYPEAYDLGRARRRAGELFGRLQKRPQETRLAMVADAEEYQTWSLCEKCCDASVREASRDLEAAAAWAHLAQEIAERVRGPEGWCRRIRGYAALHVANVIRSTGEPKAAGGPFEEAKRLWLSGSDPAGVLDPGRLFHLEASLRRAQRRFDEALACLDEAEAVGRQPELALLQRGLTLEVMGDYEGAMKALLNALPTIEGQGDVRPLYMTRFNLGVVFTHLGRYDEAAAIAQEVRELATGDENELPRVTWLEGRIAAGLGRPREARRLLAEARRTFEGLKKSYDVALALLEEAVLLLDEGRAAEVKALADELAQVFEDKGVHREALAALRLFQEAAEREEATAELARRVLRFLFLARNDQDLRFES